VGSGLADEPADEAGHPLLLRDVALPVGAVAREQDAYSGQLVLAP
jgi:hypothetical protein